MSIELVPGWSTLDLGVTWNVGGRCDAAISTWTELLDIIDPKADEVEVMHELRRRIR